LKKAVPLYLEMMREKIQGREKETSLPSESGHPKKKPYHCSAKGG